MFCQIKIEKSELSFMRFEGCGSCGSKSDSTKKNGVLECQTCGSTGCINCLIDQDYKRGQLLWSCSHCGTKFSLHDNVSFVNIYFPEDAPKAETFRQGWKGFVAVGNYR